MTRRNVCGSLFWNHTKPSACHSSSPLRTASSRDSDRLIAANKAGFLEVIENLRRDYVWAEIATLAPAPPTTAQIAGTFALSRLPEKQPSRGRPAAGCSAPIHF
jgi:hypothetical protein